MSEICRQVGQVLRRFSKRFDKIIADVSRKEVNNFSGRLAYRSSVSSTMGGAKEDYSLGVFSDRGV